MEGPGADKPSTDPRAAERLRCGAVEVYLATRELLVDGQTVAIERRAFDLLAYLMRHSDRVVDKDELWREVWESRPVTESTLPQAVSRVRKALGGEDPEAYLRNVYGVGYRFAQPVQRIGAADELAASAQPVQPGEPASMHYWRSLLWSAAVLILVLGGWLGWQRWSQRADGEPVRVAVLPVVNDTGNSDLEWVRFGVLPLIDTALADQGVPRVSSGSVLATLKRYPEATEIGEQVRLLRLNTGASEVLAPRLTADQGGFALELRAVEGSDQGLAMTLHGEDVSLLAVAAGRSLSESLARWQGAQRAQSSLVTDDPFINEAFARGLDARLRGRYEDAARYFDTVLAAAPDLLEAKYQLSLVTRRLGNWTLTDKLQQELLASAAASGNQSMLAAVQSTAGVLAWRRGDRQAAQDWYQLALDSYEAQGNADYVASVTSNLGILAATGGDYSKAEKCFDQALAHYRRSGDRYNQATTLKNLGNLYIDQGRFVEAEGRLQEALALRQQLELPFEVALTLSLLADIKMARGQWTEALAYQERALGTAQAHQSPLWEAQAHGDLSAAYRRLGRLADAQLAAARALSIATELDSPTMSARALLQRGRTELALGRRADAENSLAEAVRIYAQIEEPLGLANSLIAHAEALMQLARVDAAAQVLAEAEAVVKSAELTRPQPELRAAQAQLQQLNGDRDAALATLTLAYTQAKDAQSPALALDLGGRLGLMLLQTDQPSARAAELADQLRGAADASTVALDFLSRFHAESDPSQARELAERRRRLLGEG